jgi:hypothetical protein
VRTSGAPTQIRSALLPNTACYGNVSQSEVRGDFGRKITAKIVSDTERMKNTPMHICAKTVFVGWPSTESRRNSNFHIFLAFNNYFRKYFKLRYRKMWYGNFNHRYNVSPIHIWVWGSLRRWSACAPTAYEMVRDGRKLEKYCSRCCISSMFDTTLLKKIRPDRHSKPDLRFLLREQGIPYSFWRWLSSGMLHRAVW